MDGMLPTSGQGSVGHIQMTQQSSIVSRGVEQSVVKTEKTAAVLSPLIENNSGQGNDIVIAEAELGRNEDVGKVNGRI